MFSISNFLVTLFDSFYIEGIYDLGKQKIKENKSIESNYESRVRIVRESLAFINKERLFIS